MSYGQLLGGDIAASIYLQTRKKYPGSLMYALFWRAVNATSLFKFKKAMKAINDATLRQGSGLQILEINQDGQSMHLTIMLVVTRTKRTLLRASMQLLELIGANLF